MVKPTFIILSDNQYNDCNQQLEEKNVTQLQIIRSVNTINVIVNRDMEFLFPLTIIF